MGTYGAHQQSLVGVDTAVGGGMQQANIWVDAGNNVGVGVGAGDPCRMGQSVWLMSSWNLLDVSLHLPSPTPSDTPSSTTQPVPSDSCAPMVPESNPWSKE